MTIELSASTEQWVEQTLAGLSVDQKLGQLLLPMIGPVGQWSDPHKEFGDVQPGGIHMLPGTQDEVRAATARMQEYADIPVLITADLESGAGIGARGAVAFPEPLSLAAANDDALAYEMGRAAGVEGRDCGLHWSFGPVADVNGHPWCPIAATRTLGDDPERIARLMVQILRGQQDSGLIATAKHFPGDGFDDRDQHVCTTVNPLSMDEWFAASGRPFQAAIDAGVPAVMCGHISLPACDPGDGGGPDAAPPAAVSRKLLTGLLRERMGFDGLVVTDGLNMGGFRQWGPREDMLVACLEAGCDMLLFVDAERDMAHLRSAFDKGRLSEELIDEHVRRILRLKAHLGLHESTAPIPAPSGSHAEFEAAATAVAERSLTVVKDATGALPLQLGPGSKVLSFHLRAFPDERDVDGVDELLRAKGVEVVRATEADTESLPTDETADSFDAILMHFVFYANWMTNRIRPNGNYVRAMTGAACLRHPRTVAISYGSPYIHYELPLLPVHVNAYSSDPRTQQAVVRLLLGEIQPQGVSPVDLDAPQKFKRAGLSAYCAAMRP